MELSDFQRKAVLFLFISILIGAILLARKEPLKTRCTGEVRQDVQGRTSDTAPLVQPTPIPTKIDINTADISQIMQLPGIGPSLAKGIIQYRPYSTIEDLLKVPGIGEKRLARIKDMIDLPETKEEMQIPEAVPQKSVMPDDGRRTSQPSRTLYDSRIDPNVKCPHCDKQLWEKGKKKQKYIRCPHCLKLL